MEEKNINLNLNEILLPIIKVIGVGGAGINAVNHMFNQGIHGVEFVVCDTEIQALRQSKVKNRIQLGKDLTDEHSAECVPEKRRLSALGSLGAIKSALQHTATRMVFIITVMGGGTGTGAAPVIAELSKSMGILTIGMILVPAHFKGQKRIEQACEGLAILKEHVDCFIVIENEKIKEIYNPQPLSAVFDKANDVLNTFAKNIAEIITIQGYVNVSFADVDFVMRNSGVALMGVAETEGENRAIEAFNNAMRFPLFNSNDIREASYLLLYIRHGNKETTMDEIVFITDTLREKVGKNVNVIWGCGKDDTLEDRLRVTVIATGFNNKRHQDRDS